MQFGLVGYGAIGRMRAQALRQTPGAELRLVVEPVKERRAEAAALGLSVAESIQELLRNREIESVVVSTPPNLHREHCEAALESGKHVLCEKPLAASVQDCERMVKSAHDRGRILGTGFNYRFYPAVVKARELVAAGRIGEVDHVKAFAGHPGGPEFTHQWVHNPDIVGGGALMDNGIHVADLTLHFLGEVAESYGLASTQVWHFPGSEDNGYVLMHTATGKVGSLHASWTEWSGYHFDIEVGGTEGCVRIHYPPMMTTLYNRPSGSSRRGKRESFLFPAFQVFERLRSYRWTLVNSLVAEQVDFMERARGHKGVGATGEDGLRAVELAFSAYEKRREPQPRG